MRCLAGLLNGLQQVHPLAEGERDLRRLAEREAAKYGELLDKLDDFLEAVLAVPRETPETKSPRYREELVAALCTYQDFVLRNGPLLDFRVRTLAREILRVGIQVWSAQSKKQHLEERPAQASDTGGSRAPASEFLLLAAEQATCADRIELLREEMRRVIRERIGLTSPSS